MEEKRNDLQARLSKLQQRKNIIPSEIILLRQKFNEELAFGSPEKAEEHRGAIQALEKELEILSCELRKLEGR